MAEPRAELPSYTCPRCGMTSYNPHDVEYGYCGNCHIVTRGAPMDDLQAYLAEARRDPAFAAAYDDGHAAARIVDELVARRKAVGLTQTEVARRMGVGQPRVSHFECEDSDPRISTLYRYARAVDARLRVEVEG